MADSDGGSSEDGSHSKSKVSSISFYSLLHIPGCFTSYVLHVASPPVFLIEKEQGIQNVPLVQERVKGTLRKTVSLLLSVWLFVILMPRILTF